MLKAKLMGRKLPVVPTGLIQFSMNKTVYSSIEQIARKWKCPVGEAARGVETGRILVVDDIESTRDLLARRLGAAGHRVTQAEGGGTALQLLEAGDFDLVLLDLMMPDMNSFEVLARMKADDRLRDIPVIMISALDEMDSVVRCIEAGAEDYLPKPFDPVL
ncbi:MAG: response regulator, partial [Planctomycetes bacterium]|nr:response regulator [Planctomycetota bacterium]